MAKTFSKSNFMNENQAVEIVTTEGTQQLMRRATDVAGVCKQIVLKTALEIQGRKYVRVEGWQAIATAHGCIASSRAVEKIEGGWRAIGEIRRISDGVVLATAEGFVGMDEDKTWAKRPEYACRAMAQTRAISRACRSAFAHVVVMMEAGLSTTPAEEVPAEGFDNAAPAPAPQKPAIIAPRAEGRSFEDIVDGEKTEVVMFDDYKRVDSKPGAKRAWTAWFCKFSTDSGSQFEAGTFNEVLAATLEVLKGQTVELRHRAGKKENTREIISIAPEQEIPTGNTP
jgi:hypothetical protein